MEGAKLTNEKTFALWAPKSLDNVLFSAREQGPGQALVALCTNNLLVSYKLRTNTCKCSVDYVRKERC